MVGPFCAVDEDDRFPPARERRYRGTSLIRNSLPLGIYSSICLGPYGVPGGGGSFLMSEVPPYHMVNVQPGPGRARLGEEGSKGERLLVL